LGQRPNGNEELHWMKVLRIKALRESETAQAKGVKTEGFKESVICCFIVNCQLLKATGNSKGNRQ